MKECMEYIMCERCKRWLVSRKECVLVLRKKAKENEYEQWCKMGKGRMGVRILEEEKDGDCLASSKMMTQFYVVNRKRI